jgi:hypothetical protein
LRCDSIVVCSGFVFRRFKWSCLFVPKSVRQPWWLQVLELQLPGKKVMDAKSFQNGLKQGKKRVMKVCTEFAR